ncbi:MAG: succinate dehydrogenase cytochrome b558 subunit [Planctomycetales bacterium]|nr:succinate dehydrogenase cytochrome b558 subunit [Planctomycetales bacterium]
MNATNANFLTRHDFLIRRLHSLTGLVPVGCYMVVHLLVNSSLMNGPGAFQTNVNQIHSLGRALPLVEWLFIFLPLIFHAVIGVWIIRSGKTNTDQYRYLNNWRYTLQRWTGVVAIIFIFFHVFHLHGWFHGEWWLENVARPWGMANFKPYNAASTLATALQGFLWPIFYFVGIVCCVFHLANGIWTMGITWGVWTSDRAQKGASIVCCIGGIGLLIVGLSALSAAITTDVQQARNVEDAMYKLRVDTGEIVDNPEKRYHAPESLGDSTEEASPDEDVSE